jgi:pimeloyl-ACP methyl ester carboxylesterase
VPWIIAAVAVLVLLFAFQLVAERVGRRRYPPPGRLVDVGGYRLHVRSEGSRGPSVIFESGAGSTSLSWRLVQPDIAAFARTFAYDRAGFGWSEEASSPRTIATSAADLSTLIERAEVPTPVVLVAHSLGGAIAMRFAADHPDNVAGIVFVDAAFAELYAEFLEKFPAWLGRIGRAKLVLRIAQGAAALGMLRLMRVNVANKKLPKEDFRAGNAVGRGPRFFRTMRAEIDGLVASRDTAYPVPRTDRPAAVLSHGDPKALFKEEGPEALWNEMQRRLAARFGTEVRIVDGAGHFIQIDRPAEVVEAVRSICNRSA